MVVLPPGQARAWPGLDRHLEDYIYQQVVVGIMATVTTDMTTVGAFELHIAPTAYAVQHQSKSASQWMPNNVNKWRYAVWSPCCGRSALEGPHRFNREPTHTIVCNRCGGEWTFVLDQVTTHLITALAAQTGQHYSELLPLREMADQVAYLFVPAGSRAPASYDMVGMAPTDDTDDSKPEPESEPIMAEIPDLSGDAIVAMAAGIETWTETTGSGIIMAELVDDQQDEILMAQIVTEKKTDPLQSRSYRELQKIAKILGLPGNGKKAVLLARIESENGPTAISRAIDQL